MSEDQSVIAVERAEPSIDLIRGHKVMLDRDLAGVYGMEPRVINQAVKRSAGRFAEALRFELTREEVMRILQRVIFSEAPDVNGSKRVFEAIQELMIPPELQKNLIRFHVREEAEPLYKLRTVA